MNYTTRDPQPVSRDPVRVTRDAKKTKCLKCFDSKMRIEIPGGWKCKACGSKFTMEWS